YAPSAVERGAALVITERLLELNAPQIVVTHGLSALARLAEEVVFRVQQLGKLRIVAVTGSNGKTTTKNMLLHMLQEFGDTVAPIESFNNEVGMPITALRVTEDTEFLVSEMGASARGEIA